MIAFLDVNTLWRRKFAEALRRQVPDTLLCAPASGAQPAAQDGDIAVRLPPGWAGPLAWLAMPLLLARVRRAAGGWPRAVIVTTPHYLALARRAARHGALLYYCSDDYRSYAGWGADRMTRNERELCQIAALSIFVSETLRMRAVAEYGLDPARTFVSPNATEPRFAAPAASPAEAAALPRPVFGAAGMIDARIDLACLAAVAADPRVGSLALVGPVAAALEDDPLLARLRADPKVRFFGAQPHDAMPRWMASFDVAIIPYAATPLNHFCSPMRLYDHRAIGQPILATPYCDQIAADPAVLTGTVEQLPALIGTALARAATGRHSRVETWDDRIDALRDSPVADILFPQ